MCGRNPFLDDDRHVPKRKMCGRIPLWGWRPPRVTLLNISQLWSLTLLIFCFLWLRGAFATILIIMAYTEHPCWRESFGTFCVTLLNHCKRRRMLQTVASCWVHQITLTSGLKMCCLVTFELKINFWFGDVLSIQVFIRRNFQCCSLKVRGAIRFKATPTSRLNRFWVKPCCDTVVFGNRSPSACWWGAVCYGFQTVGVSSEVAGKQFAAF